MVKVGDNLKLEIEDDNYTKGFTLNAIYTIDYIENSKAGSFIYLYSDNGTRTIIDAEIAGSYFTLVNTRNQEQRPSGGRTHYYELPKNATELSHAIGEIKISDDTMRQLLILGIIEYDNNSVRNSNIGASNYAQHIIQPWSIIQDWDLNYWDGDIIKRVLRTKNTDSRKMDYQKIIHICEERIRQIEIETIT